MRKKKLSLDDFKEWGAQGGSASTKQKAQASRENGRKGGRPRVKKKENNE